ncbi:MAG: NAD-dependent epimerase/dehydratase family protein [Flavobacteriales bacterium]
MPKVFVTGITGLLGQNVVRDLLKHHYEVVGLLRSNPNKYEIKNENLQLVAASLFDDFSSTLMGVDYVIHIAANTSQNGLKSKEYDDVNCNASLQLAHAAYLAKVKKFIYVSTANTLGFGDLDNLGHEENPMRFPFTKSYYAQSKLKAEKELIKLKNKLNITIINPTFMLGAHDSKPSSGKLIYMVLNKKVAFYPPGGKNVVHVKDVSQAILKSLTSANSGNQFLIANENLSYLEIFKKIKKISNQKTKLIPLPKTVLITLGYIGNLLRYFGIKTSLSSANMNILCINNFFSNKKSVQELNLEYRSANSAIKEAIEYFKS